MSNMFGGFQNTDNSPSNIEKQKYTPVTKHPEVVDSYTPYQDEKGNLIWYYGDAIGIDFEFEGLVKEKDSYKNRKGGSWGYVKDFLVNKQITIELFNSRNDLVYTKEIFKEDNSAITFSLDEEESAKIIKGSYSLKINIKAPSETTSGLSRNLLTINNMILVK